MRRNKLFTGLNIFGLGTGLACSILIFLWVQDELSYDRFNPGADRIFRLTAKSGEIDAAVVPPNFVDVLKREIPAVGNATRFDPLQKIITVGTQKFDEKHMFCADTNFLRIFHYPLLAGDAANVLSAPNSVVLTESTALKYFGSVQQAMGKAVYIDNNIKGTSLQVTGVLKDIPANSHLQFDLLLPIAIRDGQPNTPNEWNNFDYYVYFQLADGMKADKAVVQSIEKQINTIRNKAIVNTDAVPAMVSAQRLTDIHLHSKFVLDVDGQGNIQYVRIFVLVAVFILLIACVNFMNLATALSGGRAKEVGLRKTIGALRSQLTLQFIGESLLLSFISLFVALLLVFLALPFFNALASKHVTISILDWRLTGNILGITLVMGLLAGSYPAFYISSFNVIKVLKGGQLLQGKGSFLRNGLVVLQFSVAVILMVSTVIIYNQLHYIRSRDIGFKRENLLYVNMPEVGDLKDNADALKAALSQSPQMGDYTITKNLPTNLETSTQLIWRGMEKGTLAFVNRLGVDDNFLRTFGMTLLSGRFFSNDFKGSDSCFVVNETALRVMKMDPATAVGKILTVNDREAPIIGVVKDFNFKPVHQRIEPLVMLHRNSGDFLVVRTNPATLQSTLSTVQHCFQRVYGNNPFVYGFVDQDLDHLYTAETRMGKLFNVFSVLSIVISCLGLFGLATFATQRRTKEIGVRKVLGAGEGGIVLLLVKEFLRLVVVSLGVAFPVAWYAMNQWLQGFVYKTTISIWTFVATGVLALLIAFLTVSFQTIRAAVANPIKSLRTE
jgi:ABC-type antimicrobial peptide transport system permease subunit